jgi:hypothetical protein
MYVAPPFSHACSAFAVALFTYTWLRVRDTWSTAGLAALGAAGALMAMTREQDVFFLAGPALDWLLARFAGRGTRAAAPGLIAAAVCFLVAYLPQLVAYKILNGHFGPHASVVNKMKWYAPHALQVLVSSEHGFFVWTPLAALAIAGLFLSLADGSSPYRAAFACLLLMAALQVFIGGSVDSWTVAGGFGQRRFVALTTVIVIGIAGLRAAAAASSARWVVNILIVAAVYWNVALTAEFATGLMNRQWLEPRKNAYDAFVTLPRMGPDLVYRYLFDRQSFYKSRPHP